jgi:hypothetical protein
MDKLHSHKSRIRKLKLKFHTTLYYFILSLFFCSTASAQRSDLIEAELEKPSESNYPKERNSGRGGGMSIDDGLVKLVYMVEPQGKPYQVMGARTSMPKFSKEAVKSINRNQFKPAMRNANPIDFSH